MDDGKPPSRWGGLSTAAIALLIFFVIKSIVVEPFQIPSGSMVPTLAIGDFIFASKFSWGLRIPFTDVEVLPLGEPERGQIGVFVYPPTQSKDPLCGVKTFPMRTVSFLTLGAVAGPEECGVDYIKRIVGLPGDTIELRDDVLWLNGVEQPRREVGAVEYVDQTCRSQRMVEYEEVLDGKPHPVLQSAYGQGPLADFGPTVVPEGHYFVMGDNRDNSADSRVWGFVPRENMRGKATMVWLSFDMCEGDIRALGSIRWGRIGAGLGG
ncbi:MAG: signal peptidase I [Myxococcota bacterium]